MSVRLLPFQPTESSATPSRSAKSESGNDPFAQVFDDSKRAYEREGSPTSANNTNSESKSEGRETNNTSSDVTSSERDQTKLEKQADANASKDTGNHEKTLENKGEVATKTKDGEDPESNGLGESTALEQANIKAGLESLIVGPIELLGGPSQITDDEGVEEDVPLDGSALLKNETSVEGPADPANPETLQRVDAVEASVAPVQVAPVDHATKQTDDASIKTQRANSDTIAQVGLQSDDATGEQEGESDAGKNTNSSPNQLSALIDGSRPESDSKAGAFSVAGLAPVKEAASSDASASALTSAIALDKSSEVKAPPPALPAQPAASELRDDANIARISRGLQSAVNQRGGNVTLRLDPPELGQVRIEMAVRDGVVNARITASTDSVRRLLTDQLGHLRQALDRQGLTIDRLEVQTASNQGSNWNSSQDESQDGRSRGQHDSSQQRSQRQREGLNDDQSLDSFEAELGREH